MVCFIHGSQIKIDSHLSTFLLDVGNYLIKDDSSNIE